METLSKPAERRGALDWLAVGLSSVGFLSYLPAWSVGRMNWRVGGASLTERKWLGAGLVGSLAGAATFVLLPERLAHSYVLVAAGLLFAVACSGRAERALGSHDDARIVIDEWIGVWIALLSCPQSFTSGRLWLFFVLFRLFDVTKGPWGSYAQAWPGGWGVTMDDVFAGIAAQLVGRWLVGG